MKLNKKNIKLSILASFSILPLFSISCATEKPSNFTTVNKENIEIKENDVTYIENSFMKNISTNKKEDAFYVESAENFKNEILQRIDKTNHKKEDVIKQIDSFIEKYQNFFTNKNVFLDNKVIFYFNYLTQSNKKSLNSVYVSKEGIKINFLEAIEKTQSAELDQYFIFIKKTDIPNSNNLDIKIQKITENEVEKYKKINPAKKIVFFEKERKIIPWTNNHEGLKEIEINNKIQYDSKLDSFYGNYLNSSSDFQYIEYILKNIENISLNNFSNEQKKQVLKSEIRNYTNKYDMLKISSSEEMKKFYPDKFFKENKIIKKYNEEYFKNNILIVNRFLHTWSGTKINDYKDPEIKKAYLTKDNKELIIEILPAQFSRPGSLGATAISYYDPGIFIEISKNQFNNINIDEINLKWIDIIEQSKYEINYFKK